MITTLEEFIEKYTKICNMGWIKTHRSGPTGIGKTLEDLLGIIENNIDGPDFGDYELKSCRLNSNSMLTIFTKTPQPQGAANTLRMTFGYSSDAYDNDEKVLHSTLSANHYVAIADTGHSLKVSCSDTKISIIAEDGKEYAYWTRDQLRKAFEKKYKENSFMRKRNQEVQVQTKNLNLWKLMKYPVLIMMLLCLFWSRERFTLTSELVNIMVEQKTDKLMIMERGLESKNMINLCFSKLKKE